MIFRPIYVISLNGVITIVGFKSWPLIDCRNLNVNVGDIKQGDGFPSIDANLQVNF